MEFIETLSQFGIDLWSMLFYAVNFLVLMVVLTVLLYNPILKFLEKRQKTIKESVEEAATLKELLEKERQEMKEARDQAQAELAAEIDRMKKTLREKEETMVKEMEERRTSMLETAAKEIDEQKTSILKAAEARTVEVIKDVVLYVVQNKVPKEVVSESVDEAWNRYKS